MLTNILVVVSVVLFFGDFINGIKYGIQNPFWIIIGSIATFSSNILLWYFWPKNKIKIIKDSAIYQISKKPILRKMIVLLLWIMTMGIFIHAFNSAGGIRYSATYLGALLTSIIAITQIKV